MPNSGRGYLQLASSAPERPERNSLCPKKLFGLTPDQPDSYRVMLLHEPPIRLSASSSLLTSTTKGDTLWDSLELGSVGGPYFAE
jgi:hypothetical protein